jgi:LPS O-antigen subunit length determinant protein (WzzB/FepE family)
MIEASGMSTPVTRGELREESERLESRLDQRLAQLATKADLEIFGDALLKRLRTELARQRQELQKTISAQISAMKAKRADRRARATRGA